jgi:hypothetical protein
MTARAKCKHCSESLPELLGASVTDVRGERIGWLVFIRHLLQITGTILQRPSLFAFAIKGLVPEDEPDIVALTVEFANREA